MNKRWNYIERRVVVKNLVKKESSGYGRKREEKHI